METNQRFEFIVSTLVKFRTLWIIPAVAGLLLAGVYVFVFKTNTWSAKQSLIVRDDLLGQSYKPGQFASLESMKSAQETILEIARKPEVIRNTLQQLGPPPADWLGGSSKNYPSDKVVEQVQGMISFSAPNGGEFGKTEVIILNTKSTSPERSRQFIEILLDEIDKKVSQVRIQRLASMEEELTQIRDAAARSLRKSTNKLREMEDRLGADVSTMHGLNSSTAGEGVKLEVSQLRLEKRVAEAELESARNSLEMVITARLNPDERLASSGEFLASQPTLQALQASLVEAQKNYAVSAGSYQPNHPLVISSRETILAMRDQIYLELETLERSVASRIKMLETKIHRLSQLEFEENERLAKLGTNRVDHFTLNAEVAKKTELVNKAYSELAEIEALRNAAGHVNWLTRVDAPQVSTSPDGLGKKSTIMAGGICGLMLGLGLVMLVAPPMVSPHQGRPGRRTDLPRRANEEYLPSPKVDEMVGPTAASAIQSTTAATAATVGKGVSLAKSAFQKNSTEADQQTESVTIPRVQKNGPDPKSAMPVSKSIDLRNVTPQTNPASKSALPTAPQEQPSKPVAPTFNVAPAAPAPAKPVVADSSLPNPTSAKPKTTEPDFAEANMKFAGPSVAKTESDRGSNQSASEILAQIRATAASKSSPISQSPSAPPVAANSESGGPKSQNQPAEAKAAETSQRTIKLDTTRAAKIQKTSNVRPVDLARSASDGSTTFVQIPRRDEARTQPIDDFMETIEPLKKTAEPTKPAASRDTAATPVANPFLKNLPTRKPNPPTGAAGGPAPQNKSAEEQNAQLAESQKSNVQLPTRSEEVTTPIPDQIKNLSDSIANFAKPLKTERRPTDDPNF